MKNLYHYRLTVCQLPITPKLPAFLVYFFPQLELLFHNGIKVFLAPWVKHYLYAILFFVFKYFITMRDLG